jgi:hypothetical protein
MVEIVDGYVTSADVCMVTQSPRKYSINYGIWYRPTAAIHFGKLQELDQIYVC